MHSKSLHISSIRGWPKSDTTMPQVVHCSHWQRESPLLHGLPPSTLTQNTMTHTQDSAPPAPQTHLPQPESTPTVLSQHTVQSPTKVGSAPYRTRSGRICKPNSRYEQWVLLMVNLVALWFLYMLNVFIMYLLFLYWQYRFFCWCVFLKYTETILRFVSAMITLL